MLGWTKNAGHSGRCDFSCVKLVLEVFFLSRSMHLRNILMLLMWDIGVGEWVWILLVNGTEWKKIIYIYININLTKSQHRYIISIWQESSCSKWINNGTTELNLFFVFLLYISKKNVFAHHVSLDIFLIWNQLYTR